MNNQFNKLFFCIPDVIEYDGVDYYSNPIAIMVKRYSVLANKIICTAPIKKVSLPSSEKITHPSINYINLPKLNTLFSFFNYSKIRNTIRKYLLDCDICIIHVHTSFISTITANLARELKIPTVNIVCGCAWDALWNYNWKGKLLAPIAFWALKYVQKHATHSIYVTENFLQRRYPTTGKSISCSNVELIDDKSFNINQRIKTIKQTNRRKKIATIAAVDVKYKGQQYIIESLKYLKKLGIDFEYHIVGSGDSTYLEQCAKENGVSDLVVFHGPIKHSLIPQFLDDIDIYAQPSKQEGLPRSVIEAMNRGCLCIGSNIAGIPDLIEQPFLFTKGKVSEIVHILSNLDTAIYIQQAAHNHTKSLAYTKNILDQKRTEFLTQFRNEYFNQ